MHIVEHADGPLGAEEAYPVYDVALVPARHGVEAYMSVLPNALSRNYGDIFAKGVENLCTSASVF